MKAVSRILPVPCRAPGSAPPTLGGATTVAIARVATLVVVLSAGAAAEAVAQGVEEDRAALVALYRATNGASWADSSNWATAAPLHEWFGVKTDVEGRVAILDLHGNGLSGPLPSSLGNLGHLVNLALHDNGLSGPIPGSLGNLSSLETLWLDQNRLSGPIPGSLGNLSALEDLTLSGNELSGPIPGSLGNLSNLVSLWLADNGLSGPIPGNLGNLTNLDSLTLDNDTGLCLAPDFPPESEFARLALEIGLTDCDVARDRAALVALYDSTGGAGWTDSGNWRTLAPLGDWHGVTTDAAGRVTGLVLDDNGLTGPIPPELGDLARLEVLSLSRNALTGPVSAELGALANLEWLDLSSNNLTGPVPRELGSLAKLTWLTLNGNGLTGPVPAGLGNLGRLRVLYLHENDLSGRIPGELGGLTSLEWLDLSSNALTGRVPAGLENLDLLRGLYLDGNELSGPIPVELGRLSSLLALSLALNDLTGPVPSSLGDLDQLQLLLLYDNELSGRIPVELGSLTSLSLLDLSMNDLTGRVPAELGNLANLEWLSLSHNWTLSGSLPPRRRFPRLSFANIMATRACGSADWRDRAATLEFAGTLCGAPGRNVTVDVAAVYTPAARVAAGGPAAIEASIDLGVAEINQALAASGVRHRLRLVDRFEVAYDETGDALLDFWRIVSPSDGHLDELHALRDRVGADLVNLVVGESDECAAASFDYAFSVARRDCDFAHAIGLSLGIRPDRYESHDGGRGGAHPGYGYVNQPGLATGAARDRRWRTMMAESTQCSDANVVCPRILRFSNPRQTWNGDPLGVPYGTGGLGVGGAADAAAVLEVTGPAVAGLRDRPPGANRPPAAAGALPDLRLALHGSLDVDVSAAFVDPDGDALTYTVSSSAPDVVTVLAAGDRVTLTAVAPGRAVIEVRAADPDGLSAAQTLGVRVTAPFTDDPIRPGVTPVRAVHFTELRARIDVLRREAGLARFAWTDPELRAGVTPVRLAHLLELRTALAAAYAAAGRPEPHWTDTAPVPGVTPIRAVHLTELRAAVVTLE